MSDIPANARAEALINRERWQAEQRRQARELWTRVLTYALGTGFALVLVLQFAGV